MPTPRKSLAQLSPRTLSKNRGRYANRTQPVELPPLGYAPKHLSESQKALWRELVNSAPKGLLTIADQFVVELSVMLIERVRNSPNPKPSELSVLLGYLGKMGLNPRDRSSLDIPETTPPDADDPWERF